MLFSSDEEDEEVPDKPTDEEMGNDHDPLDFPSEESSSDEDKKEADPEWKLLEEQAESSSSFNLAYSKLISTQFHRTHLF